MENNTTTRKKRQYTPRKKNVSESNSQVYNELRSAAFDCGLTISEMCRRADVDFRLMEDWRKKTPKTLLAYFRLKEVLAQARIEPTIPADDAPENDTPRTTSNASADDTAA